MARSKQVGAAASVEIASGKSTLIQLAELAVDTVVQMRPAISPQAVERYKSLMGDGVEFPPVSVVRTLDHGLVLAHGFHRYWARHGLGEKTINAEVTDGTLRDAALIACQANATNGLPRCRETERRACYLLFSDEEWGKKPVTEQAAFLGIARRTVQDHKQRYLGEKTSADIKREKMEELERKAKLTRPPVAPVVNGKSHAAFADDEVESDADADANAEAEAEESDDSRTVGVYQSEPEPEPESGAELDAEAELEARTGDDREFLDTLPLYHSLAGIAREIFIADAMYYRRVSEARMRLHSEHRSHAVKAEPGVAVGHYQSRCDWFLRTQHPRDWKLCLGCDGRRCDSCRKTGYIIP